MDRAVIRAEIIDVQDVKDVFVKSPLDDKVIHLLECTLHGVYRCFAMAVRLLGPVHGDSNVSRELRKFVPGTEKSLIRYKGLLTNNVLTASGLDRYIRTNRVLKRRFPRYRRWLRKVVMPRLLETEPSVEKQEQTQPTEAQQEQTTPPVAIPRQFTLDMIDFRVFDLNTRRYDYETTQVCCHSLTERMNKLRWLVALGSQARSRSCRRFDQR